MKPETEPSRLDALKRMGVLDTPAEERFDRITRLTKKFFRSDIAAVSLIDEERQWFKSAQGFDLRQTDRASSFCGHTIQAADTLVVPDAREDPRFYDNPLVIDSPRVRFYAAQPLRSPEGLHVGTLAVFDREPREPCQDELAALRDFAELAEGELLNGVLSQAERDLRAQLEEAERRASVDGLTRLWNRSATAELLRREIERAKREPVCVGAAIIDVDHFKSINDTHGHAVGDEVLKAVSERLRWVMRPYDCIGRWGGEEFLAVLANCQQADANVVGARICEEIRRQPIVTKQGLRLDVTASVGVGGWTGDERVGADGLNVEWVVETIDAALYRAKAGGRDRIEPIDGAN